MEATTAWSLILVCLVLSAFFSGSETALLRLSHGEVDREAKTTHKPSAVAIRELLSSTSRLLVTILLGNNLVNILAASIASALAVSYLGEGLGIFAASAVLTLVVLVLCEVLPKAVAARGPRRFAHVVALPLYLIHQMLRPVHAAYDHTLERLVKRISGPSYAEGSRPPEEIFRLAVQAGRGQPRGSPLAILSGAASAVNSTVEEIMVPASAVVAYPIDSHPAELLERALDERFTRFPLYDGSLDRVVGVLHFKDLVKFARRGGRDLREIARPVHRVPDSKPILELLAEMQQQLVQLAIVKDEFSRTEGIVTQEDILEEIVGEIRDEFDSEELLMVRPVGAGAYRALGRVRIADFNRETGWELQAQRGDTLGGLVFDRLGRQPRRGDSIELPGYEIRVLGVSGTHVTQVHVRRRTTSPRPAGAKERHQPS